MNGDVAQIVALTCHGNAVLRGKKTSRFFPSNSTCRFCDRIEFVEMVKPLFRNQREKVVAQTPDSWFQWLARKGASGIRLWWSRGNEVGTPDRMLAGFVGGGGTWTMEVRVPSGMSALWVARHDVWNQDAPDNKIWRVTYGHVSDQDRSTLPELDMLAVSEHLLIALQDIHRFSDAHDCGGFTRCFDRAIGYLTTSNRSGFPNDLAPKGSISPVAEAILDACQSAWVFGGMGFWNDMGFDGKDQLEYNRVSKELFEALTDSLSSVATSSVT
jgi:hypothetical protein